MDFLQLIDNLTPEIHQRLKRAVELGRWPDGTRLSAEQRELSLQAVIAYEARHVEASERVGYIDRGSKAGGEVCDSPATADAQPDSAQRDAAKPDNVRWIH